MRTKKRFQPQMESIERRLVLTANPIIQPLAFHAAIAAQGTLSGMMTHPASSASATLTQPALAHDLVTRGLTVTQAVIELNNASSLSVGLQFRWNSSSAWSNVTIAPGHYQLFWINNSSSLAPQVQFDQSVLPGWQNKLYSLGYYTYTGSGGTPPVSAARLYQFQNVSGGIDLFSVTTQSVTAFKNSSNLTVSFQFRWNTSSNYFSTINLAPGQTYYYWTTPPNAASPQIQFDQSVLPGWQAKTYALNFNIYKGSGQPPFSSARLYTFLNVAGGVDLFG